MPSAAPALDLLLALTARHAMVSIDARELPVCVAVQTEAGPRNYFGPDVAGALARAVDALSPRACAPGDDPEPLGEVIPRVLSKLKSGGSK